MIDKISIETHSGAFRYWGESDSASWKTEINRDGRIKQTSWNSNDEIIGQTEGRLDVRSFFAFLDAHPKLFAPRPFDPFTGLYEQNYNVVELFEDGECVFHYVSSNLKRDFFSEFESRFYRLVRKLHSIPKS